MTLRVTNVGFTNMTHLVKPMGFFSALFFMVAMSAASVELSSCASILAEIVDNVPAILVKVSKVYRTMTTLIKLLSASPTACRD